MERTLWITLVTACITVVGACTETDLRDTRPDRTRTADGIIKLYGNQRQGDWMLKGKVIQVESATVVEVSAGNREIVVTGRESVTPIPMVLELHTSETGASRIEPGDLVTFKGVCNGMNGTIRFDSCLILGVWRPASAP